MSPEEAISLLKRTQEALKLEGNLRLYKICSNSCQTLSAFNKIYLAKDLRDLDFDHSNLPLQRSLGVCWDLHTDSFTFRVNIDEKPYTRRGVLPVVNGLYDPLGFATPVTIGGKLLFRQAMVEPVEWDQPLPDDFHSNFISWRETVTYLEGVNIPRTYCFPTSTKGSPIDLFVFSDASEKAIAVVAYLRTVDEDGRSNLGFVMGKTKVAPKRNHTIPSLELHVYAAVMDEEVFETVLGELEFELDRVTLFTDRLQ